MCNELVLLKKPIANTLMLCKKHCIGLYAQGVQGTFEIEEIDKSC